jgi:hypothetical protein
LPHHPTGHQAVDIYCDSYVKFASQCEKYDSAASKVATPESYSNSFKKQRRDDGSSLSSATGWSDDESDSDDAAEDIEFTESSVLKAEAKRCLKAFRQLDIDWKMEYPTADLSEPVQTMELMTLDMGTLYKKLEKIDPDRKKFGYLLLIASSSWGQIGALGSESHSERMIPCANDGVTDANTLLGDKEIEMLVMLRMNREFMEYMRKNINALSKQQFETTIIRFDAAEEEGV